MASYNSILRHVSMMDLKRNSLKLQKHRLEEERRIQESMNELKYKNSPDFSDWRCEINEGMTTANLMTTTLPATGDADLVVTNLQATSFENSDQVSFEPGTNSGLTGGFNNDSGIANLSGTPNYNTAIDTNPIDLSLVDTLSITAVAGDDFNGGVVPHADLLVSFYDQDFNLSDSYPVISKTTSSFRTVNITIPKEWRRPGVSVSIFSNTSLSSGPGNIEHGVALSSFTIPINGLNHATIGTIPFGVGGSTGVNSTINSYLKQSATTANYKSLGQILWGNIQNAKNGFSLGDNPNYGQPGETQYISLNNWDPAPVSGNRNQNGSAPDANGNDVEGVTDADYIYIGKYIFDTYKNYNVYGVSNISFKRKTPVSIIVPLDSPEATAFIRTDPVMIGLSAEERKKKLIEMLDAGDEYLLKQLGLIGSKARPTDTTMPDSWEQAAGGATDAMSDDLYNWVNKTYGLPAAEWKKDNPGKPDNSNPYLPKGSYVPKADAGSDDTQVAGTTDYGDIAATYGGADAERKQKLDAWKKKNTMPGRGIYPYRPGTTQPYNPQTDLDLSAHYEPQGEVLSEKKKLKSPKDIASKIPGYYDGKPAPLGFPETPPPKMKNGFHSDLVTSDGQKKQSNRYNTLDPISAKSMPPTGNPFIDKKVAIAKKKPK